MTVTISKPAVVTAAISAFPQAQKWSLAVPEASWSILFGAIAFGTLAVAWFIILRHLAILRRDRWAGLLLGLSLLVSVVLLGASILLGVWPLSIVAAGSAALSGIFGSRIQGRRVARDRELARRVAEIGQALPARDPAVLRAELLELDHLRTPENARFLDQFRELGDRLADEAEVSDEDFSRMMADLERYRREVGS